MSDLPSRIRERGRDFLRGFTPRRIRARWTGPRVFANSVPKSGTNLLLECLRLFPVLRPGHRHVSMNSNRRPGSNEFERKVPRTKRGQYTSGHAFHSDSHAATVEEHGIDVLLMVRDPRDVVTSHFHYVTEKHPGHRLHEHYRSLPDDHARLMASIRGVDGEFTADGDPLEGIGEWMDRFLAWDEEPYTQVVRFEDLIGPRGGGNREAQVEAVRTVAAHLDVDLSDDEVGRIARNVFSTDSSTFRKGLIGDWRNHFEPEHVEAFERAAGDWLVELGYEPDGDWSAEAAADGLARSPDA